MFAYLNAQLPSKLFGEIKRIADDTSDLKKKVQLDQYCGRDEQIMFLNRLDGGFAQPLWSALA
jgi:hypothetical protein